MSNHYLQFATDADGVHEALIHEQLYVGIDEEGESVYRSFISPTDPDLDGVNGIDPIIEGTWAKYGGEPLDSPIRPWWFGIGLAVRLQPTKTGWEPIPATASPSSPVAVVMEPKYRFWGPLVRALEQVDGSPGLDELIFKATRSGAAPKHTWTFESCGVPLPPQIERTIDLQDVFDRLADPLRIATRIDPLPSTHRFFQ